MYHSRKKGFTMVELVIVIAVIAILAAILIPTFTNLIRKANEASALANARNAANQLLANLLARGDDAKDLVIFNQKGDDIYVYGYSAEAGRVLAYYGNPVDAKSIDGETLEDKAEKLLKKMLANGELTLRTPRPTETDWWHPSKMEEVVTGLNFKPEEMVLRADYKIVLARFEKGGQPEHTCTAADLDEIAEVPATCSTNGYPAYWVCRVCGKAYHDADATDPVSAEKPLKPTDINSDNHQLGAWQYDESKHWQNCTLNPGHTHLNEAAHTGNPCTVCGYSTGGNTPTSPAVEEKDGLHSDGFYYKDNVRYTGTETDNGETFEFVDGRLVVKATVESGISDFTDYRLTYTVTSNEKYATKEVLLKTEDTLDQYVGKASIMPGNATATNVVVSGAYTVKSINVRYNLDFKGAIEYLAANIGNKTKGEILSTLKDTYGFDESYYPVMTGSDKFQAYLNELKNKGVITTASVTADNYATIQDTEYSFGQYLREQYGVSSILALPWTAKVNYSDSINGKWPSTNTGKEKGIFAGEVYRVSGNETYFTDPEMILLYFKHTYDNIFFTGISSDKTKTEKLLSNMYYGSGDIYSFEDSNWMSAASVSYGIEMQSLYSIGQNGNMDTSKLENKANFYMFTASHQWLMTNMYQVRTFVAPIYTMIAENVNWTYGG